jgi:hypothetical protein
VIMTAAYAPQLGWPPLLAALTVAYAVRRCRPERSRIIVAPEAQTAQR